MCVRASLEEGLRKGNEKYLYLNESSIINIYWIQSYLQGGTNCLTGTLTNGRVETMVQLKHAALWCGALLVLGYLWNLAQVLSLVIPSWLSSDKTKKIFWWGVCKHFLSEGSLYSCLRTTLATGEGVQKSGIYTPNDVFGPEALLLSVRINRMLCVGRCLLGIEAEQLPDERWTLKSPLLISHPQ